MVSKRALIEILHGMSQAPNEHRLGRESRVADTRYVDVDMGIDIGYGYRIDIDMNTYIYTHRYMDR